MDKKNHFDIDEVLKKAGKETPPPFHMQRMLNTAKQKASRRNIMTKRYFAPIASTTFIVALVIAMLFIPVTYKIHVGSLVTIEWTPNGKDVTNVLSDFQSLDNAVNVNYQSTPDLQKVFVAFEGIKSSKATKLVRDLLDNQSDIDGFEISSSNIIKEVGGNALAAITGGRIVINAKGLTDDEIETVLLEQLSVAGYNVNSVSVQTDADGVKHMEFSFEVDSETTSEQGAEEETTIEINY